MANLRIGMVVLAVMLGWVDVSSAQIVVSKGFTRRPLAVTGFAGETTVGSQLTDVLRNDVRLSGSLGLAEAGDAEFVQQGTVRSEGGKMTVTCAVVRRATQESVWSASYPVAGQELRRLGHQISDDMVLAVTGQHGIAQTRIAFVLTRGPVKELAVMDYDGHNVRQLTNDRTLNVHPRWSPDGSRIIYTSYWQRFPDVLEADIFTGQRRRVASYPGLDTGAVYSPDGRTLALILSKDGNPELYTMDAKGGGLRRLTRTRGAESSPTWSPDGQEIAYVSDDGGAPQIYVIGRAGGDPRKLTVSPSYNTEPCWSHSPAGSLWPPLLAVTSRQGGRFQIRWYDEAGGELKELVADGADNLDPSWAPDGRHLVYAKLRNWRSKLWLVDAVTREQIELPGVAEGEMSEPAWGP